MTPEERKGIEKLLAGMTGDEPVYAWLKLQLKHHDWDNSIERMGGGKTARDAYMNPIFDGRCAVTAFDMHAQVTADGRERGLWVWLSDESKARAERYETWAQAALETFCMVAGIDDKTQEKFSVSMAMDEFKNVANSKVHEAALLEWPAVEKLHKVIGAALAKYEGKRALPRNVIAMEKEAFPRARGRKPKKPDRRADNRRRDDKRKARLR